MEGTKRFDSLWVLAAASVVVLWAVQDKVANYACCTCTCTSGRPVENVQCDFEADTCEGVLWTEGWQRRPGRSLAGDLGDWHLDLADHPVSIGLGTSAALASAPRAELVLSVRDCARVMLFAYQLVSATRPPNKLELFSDDKLLWLGEGSPDSHWQSVKVVVPQLNLSLELYLRLPFQLAQSFSTRCRPRLVSCASGASGTSLALIGSPWTC